MLLVRMLVWVNMVLHFAFWWCCVYLEVMVPTRVRHLWEGQAHGSSRVSVLVRLVCAYALLTLGS